MKRSALLVFVGFLVGAAWVTTVQAAPDTVCLWKVSGAQNNVYLLGSIHFLKKDFYPLPEPMESAFTTAQRVVFETDLTELQSPQTQMKMLMMGMGPPDKTLRDYISKETYEALQKHLGGEVGPLERLKPWIVAVGLVAMEIQKLGFNPEHGVDRYFHNKATKEGKPTAGLETVQFQMDLFGNLSEQDQEEFLKQTLAELSQLRTMFNDITQAWQSGDVAALEKQLLAAMKEHPQIERKFLSDRNRDWIPKIKEYLKGPEDVLVVVGAAHLVGDESVVALLRKEGLKVEQQHKSGP